MSGKNKLAQFPVAFLEIAEAAFEQREIAPLQVPDEKASYSQLHRFNRFRNILVEEGHPFAIAAKDLIARREHFAGSWRITFQAGGLYSKEEITGERLDFPAPQLHKQISYVETEEQRDEGEEFFKKLLEKARGTESQ